ncbi:MAG: histone deacetylase family protein [Deltaproteobacteria bacterium]|nr:histone deacetylase family protein [Deltaproteobacteria bacterium]
MEAIVTAIENDVTFLEPTAADESVIGLVHSQFHIDQIRSEGLYEIAALAAGGAIAAVETGLRDPSFGLIRPPEHHASSDSCRGFYFFNNMAVAIENLMHQGKISTAFILDFDLHYGDGNVNILGNRRGVTILNPGAGDRVSYVVGVQNALENTPVDIIGVSAGFDSHKADWGGLLSTTNYYEMGQIVRTAAKRNQGGCFGILEGGYNHAELGQNVRAFLRGLAGSIFSE